MFCIKLTIDLINFEDNFKRMSLSDNKNISIYPALCEPKSRDMFMDPDSESMSTIRFTLMRLKNYKGIKHDKVVTHAERLIQADWDNLVPMNYRLWLYFRENIHQIPEWVMDKIKQGYKIIFDGSVFEYKSGCIRNESGDEQVVDVVCAMYLDDHNQLVFGVCPADYGSDQNILSLLNSLSN